MANIYKRIAYTERDSRPARNLTETERQKGIDILEKFRNHFIAKHLS